MQSSFSGLKTAKGSQVFGVKQSWASASPSVTRWWHQPVHQSPPKGSYLGPRQSRGPTTAVMGTSTCISSSLELPGEQGHSSFILLVLPGPLSQPLCEGAGEALLVALSATLSFLPAQKKLSEGLQWKALPRPLCGFAGDSSYLPSALHQASLSDRLPSGFQDQGSWAGVRGSAQGNTSPCTVPYNSDRCLPPVPSTARTSKDTSSSTVRGRSLGSQEEENAIRGGVDLGEPTFFPMHKDNASCSWDV